MATKPTTQPSKIEPPEGWKPHSDHGVMRCGNEPSDRLVRLYDVVVWLMNSQELPLAAAVERVCSALEKHGVDGVHVLDSKDYAVRVDTPSPWDEFAGKIDGPELAKSLRATWLIEPYALERLVNNPDFAPEYDASQQTPFEFSNRPGNPVARYAITWYMANKHWGWGGVAGAVSDDGSQPNDKQAELLAMLDAYEKKGNKTRAQFAKDRVLTEYNLKKQLALARVLRKENAANPFSRLVVVAGKK